MQSTNSSKWTNACQTELNTLLGYYTWDLVNKPLNINIVGNRWVFCVKSDNLGNVNKYKAHTVAQGFSQKPRVDFNETYSPTVQLTSICFILALADKYSLELLQVNVKGEYLSGKLDEDIYIQQPKGFIKPGTEHLICKLNRGLYGLKKSRCVWHHTLK